MNPISKLSNKVHPDFHGHFTFWTKFWDQVRVSRTKFATAVDSSKKENDNN